MRRVWVVAIIALLLFTFVPSAEGASTPNVQKIVSVKLGKGTTGKEIVISGEKMFVFGGKKQHTEMGDYIFDALWIFSLKNSKNPKLLGEWLPKSPGFSYTGGTVSAHSLFVDGNTVYLSTPQGVCVLDVSNPESVKYKKTIFEDIVPLSTTKYKHYLIGIGVNGYAYADISTNYSTKELKIKGFDKFGDYKYDFAPTGAYVSGNTLYLTGSGFVAADISNLPETVVKIALKDENGDLPDFSKSAILGHYIVGNGTTAFPNYRVVDLKNNSYHSICLAQIKDLSLVAFAKEGRTLYTLTDSGNKLVCLDALDMVHPKFQWLMDTNEKCIDIAVHLGYVYLLSDGKIDVYNVAPFKDVNTDYWAINAIKYMVSKDIISGYPDGTFKPEKIVTRAEYAKMLALSLNLDVSKGRNIYTDVPEVHWAYKYITAVTNAKLMKGYGKGKFGPDDTVKKEEILTTIVRLKKWELVNPAIGTFPDVPKKYWAYPFIETAVKNRLIKKVDKGLTDGNFHIKVGATRAQTAELLFRAIVKYPAP